ncbi:MAG: hypothetical protein EBS77_10925, partial [Gammaproteobacteria bacterium]|nr:hypothetical protein [Gammaproteobacteria bacterium]
RQKILWTPESLGCPFADRCPLVEARCHQEMPPVVAISKDHFVRCHALSPDALSAERDELSGDHSKLTQTDGTSE